MTDRTVTKETTINETTANENAANRIAAENSVTEHPEADEDVTTHAEPTASAGEVANTDSTGGWSSLTTEKRRRVDLFTLVIGLVYLVIALTALTDRLWIAVDTVLVLGGLTVALGVAMMIGTLRRNRSSPQRDR